MGPDFSHTLIDELASRVRNCYRSDPGRAESLIETCLNTRLEGWSLEEKLSIMKELRSVFEISQTRHPESMNDQETASSADLFSLVLGQRVSGAELGSGDLVERLAGSLNQVFDHLNDLVGIINATFGNEAGTLETIRQIIGSDLAGEKASGSLAGYIGQIKEAFLVANQASKAAAAVTVGRILGQLDPDRLAGEAEKGMRFGFMRKGELFESYRERYGQVKKWFEAGHFEEDFSREFERACQRLHTGKGGTT